MVKTVGGYFKVYRDIFKHEIFKHELDFRMFMLILGNAAYQDTTIEGVPVKRGQWVRSYRMLMKDLEYKEKRGYKQYGIATIKRAIERLIKSGLVTVSETEHGTLFTVVNYEEYQGTGDFAEQDAEQLEERNRNETGTLPEQKEENKNLINDEEEEDIGPLPPLDFTTSEQDELIAGQIEQIKRHFSKKTQRIWYSAKEDDAMTNLLKAGIPVETIIQGIDLAFERFVPQHSRDRIKSFNYCLDTIYEVHEKKQRPRGGDHAARPVRPGRNQKTDSSYEIGKGYYDDFPGIFAN